MSRVVHPLTLPADVVGGDGGDYADPGPSAFPSAETGGSRDGAVINFHAGSPTSTPLLTLIAVTRPLGGASAALAAAVIAGALPAPGAGALPALVVAAQRLPAAIAGAKGVVCGGDVEGVSVPAGAAAWPSGGAVADPFAAAALHALPAVGRRTTLISAAGHRPPADASEDDGLLAATLLGDAVAGVTGVRLSQERAARLAPARRVVRGGAGGGELMYS